MILGRVRNAELDGRDRVVTFFGGSIMKEVFLGADIDARRVARTVTVVRWGVLTTPASAQVVAEGSSRKRLSGHRSATDDVAGTVRQLMARGLEAMKTRLEQAE